MFKLQSLSQYSPFDAIHLLRLFSTAQNRFWTHQFWCVLVLLFFVSPLPHQQNGSFWGLFSPRETKEVAQGKIVWRGRTGHWGHVIFGQNCWTPSTMWAGVLVNHPSWNGQMHWKALQKKLAEAEGSLLQLTLIQMGSWNTHLVGEACTTGGTPSRRQFQFFVSPLV